MALGVGWGLAFIELLTMESKTWANFGFCGGGQGGGSGCRWPGTKLVKKLALILETWLGPVLKFLFVFKIRLPGMGPPV
jgi:hypothetical protein